MPQKCTATNLRRLFVNMQLQADNRGHRVLLSLDANKAFNSIGWRYSWAVLSRFGSGDRFIAWVRLLYASPEATIRMSDGMSHAFALGRGVSCPPALCYRHRAISGPGESPPPGFRFCGLHEKIMLYADDMLFLGDTTTSLAEVTAMISNFGHYSCLTINWSKSALMGLDEDREVEQLHNSPVVIHLKIFRVVNILFRRLLWNAGPPSIKLEQLKYPKDSGGLAVPSPWLYYLAAQMQHLIGSMAHDPVGSSC